MIYILVPLSLTPLLATSSQTSKKSFLYKARNKKPHQAQRKSDCLLLLRDKRIYVMFVIWERSKWDGYGCGMVVWVVIG